MHFFEYKDHSFNAREFLFRKIAEKVGTPFYLYSYHTWSGNFTVFDDASKEFLISSVYLRRRIPTGSLRLFIILGVA